MASPSFIIGIIGNIISILGFMSPIKTFVRVVKRKSTEDFQVFPYIMTLLATSLWTFYGILKPNGLLIVTVNGAGASLQLVYVIIFLIYAPRDKKLTAAKMAAILNVAFLGGVIVVSLLALHDTRRRLTLVGFICLAFSTIVYGAPLSAMRTVIKTESVEFMPFLLTFALFLNAGIWMIYSSIVKDLYLFVPSVLGVILGMIQLILYAIYKRKSKSTISTVGKQEENPENMIKGDIEKQEMTEE